MSNPPNHHVHQQHATTTTPVSSYPSGFYAPGSALAPGVPPPPPPPPPYGQQQSVMPYNYSNSPQHQHNPASTRGYSSSFPQNNPNNSRPAPFHPYHGADPGYHYHHPSHPPSGWNHHHPQHQQYEQRQSNPRPPPPPPPRRPKKEEWKCEACNHTVHSKAALEAHTASHIQCSSCDFCAAPKIVKAHYQAVHGKYSSNSGEKGGGFKTITVAVPGCPVQRFRICVGNRPQDIQKWIAERKRRFPRSGRKVPVAAAAVAPEKPKDEKKEEESSSEKTGGGLMSLLDGYGSSSSSEKEKDESATRSSNEMNKRPRLAEEKDEAQKDDMESKKPRNVEPKNAMEPVVALTAASSSSNYRTKPCRFFVRNGTCRNGDACRFRHNVTTDNTAAATTTTESVSNHNASRRTAPRRKNTNGSSSLLQKLLKTDAQRESILTLQLIDYIVETDFLSQQGTRRPDE